MNSGFDIHELQNGKDSTGKPLFIFIFFAKWENHIYSILFHYINNVFIFQIFSMFS